MAEPIAVRTTNGTPEAPEFEVEFVPGSGVNVKWNEANCATGYKVYYKVEADENEAVADASNSELMKAFEETTACQTYLYSVTTLVNEEESTRIGDNWKNVLIPPKASAKPSIKLVTTDHDNVTLQISPAEDNKQCKIDLYKIVYSSGCCDLKESCESKTVEFTPEEAQDGQVLLNLEGAAHADTIYKAQVSYGNEWSEEASFGVQSCPVDEPEPVKFPLIPVVVGVAILALVIIVVTLLLVKRSRNRNFDPEKG
jgi:hypothetical protein